MNTDNNELATQAKAVLGRLMQLGYALMVSVSFGKDSSVVASLVLTIAAELRAQGVKISPIAVLHSDTGVENPEVHTYAMDEMIKMKHFAQTHDIDLRIGIAKPHISSSWAYRVIGTGKIPIFPSNGKSKKKGQSHDCTIDYKVVPLKRLRKKIYKQLLNECPEDLTPITVLGTRFEESTQRKARMEERQESADRPWLGDDGTLHLSPIAHWSTRDVWRYLNNVLERRIESYSDFENTFRIYEDAASGTSCAVEADIALGTLSASRGCGARHGCWACCVIGEDKSMTSMINTDPQYHYMKGLNRLQRFLLASRYDWSRREQIGRTINEAGYIRIQPDVYSASMREELLRYALTIDAEEVEAAQRVGLSRSRFEIIPLDTLIAIDAEWSKTGMHNGFHALKIWRDIMIKGKRYPVPEIETVERTPLPAPRYFYVGSNWDEDEEYAYTGLASPLLESLEGCAASETRVLPATDANDELKIMNIDLDTKFKVDHEGLEFIMMDMDYLIDKFEGNSFLKITAGFHHYLTLGALTFSKSQPRKLDMILRRTAFRERHGLVGPNINLGPLVSISISHKEMSAILDATNIETPVLNTGEPEKELETEYLYANEQFDLFAA